jgi:anti-anti-sigma factor
MKPHNSVLATARAAGTGVSRSNGKAGNKVLAMSLECVCLGRAVVLRCGGRMVFRSDAEGLSGLICEVLPQARRMVVDLAAVHFLDSGALGELVLAQMWAQAAGYELRFSSPSEPVLELLESANLLSFLNIDSTVESALAAMQQQDALHS